jgi:PAS domain S-box-containing protein
MRTGQAVRDSVIGIYNRRENRYRWVLGGAIPRFLAGEKTPSLVYVTMLDITERKKMEDDLRESEQRFRAVFEQAAVGVALLNTRTGQYVRVNQRYCDFLGYTMQEMLQKTLVDVTFPEDVQQNLDANAQLIDGTLTAFAYEKRYVRKDGSLVWGNLTISPLWKPGEKPTTYLHIAIVEDITERKQAEKEREALQEQLLGARKLEAVGRLAGGVAHNFNNLLTGIMGSIEIARMDTPPDSPAVQSLETAQAAAAEAAGLARKLLAFGRNAMIIPVTQHANDLVESALDLIASSLPASVEIVRDLSPDAWDVLADTAQMTGVLLELVENAREAMGDTGVVTVRTRNATITEEYVATHPYARAGDALVISVADTGPGIDPAVMDHLFEPFATTKQAGRGLGLAMVFGSMKQAGGWIDVISDHGAGTEVSLYLPRYTPAA